MRSGSEVSRMKRFRFTDLSSVEQLDDRWRCDWWPGGVMCTICLRARHPIRRGTRSRYQPWAASLNPVRSQVEVVGVIERRKPKEE